MTGYAIFQIEITNPEEYKNYVAKASGIVAKYGGEYLVRGGDYECVELSLIHISEPTRPY